MRPKAAGSIRVNWRLFAVPPGSRAACTRAAPDFFSEMIIRVRTIGCAMTILATLASSGWSEAKTFRATTAAEVAAAAKNARAGDEIVLADGAYVDLQARLAGGDAAKP